MANRGETHAGGDLALKMINPKMVKAALKVLVTADLPAQIMFARADWTRFISDIGMTPSILSRFEQATSASGGFGDALQGMSASEQAERVQQIVLKTAKATLHIDTLAADAPLMEAGMDSLTAVEFRNKLTQELPGVKLASTLMFDYPNVEAIATFALGQIAPSAAAASKPIARVATVSTEAAKRSRFSAWRVISLEGAILRRDSLRICLQAWTASSRSPIRAST
jgi:acyl carrier protein